MYKDNGSANRDRARWLAKHYMLVISLSNEKYIYDVVLKISLRDNKIIP